MRRLPLLPLLLALGAATVTAQAPSAKNDSFTDDAGDAFSAMAAGTRTGFYFVLARAGMLERTVTELHLSEQSRWDAKLGSLGGVWNGHNASGVVSLRIWAPDIMNKTVDHALVVFQPATERPIPEALLSHLLAKAESTKVSGANTLDIELPSERLGGKNQCFSTTTLTVRLDTGALVLNSLRTFCDVPKDIPK